MIKQNILTMQKRTRYRRKFYSLVTSVTYTKK